jgi:hypothetical protein
MGINWRNYLADTTAALSFWTMINAFSEIVIARMPWKQVLIARVVGPLLYLPVARLYGLYRDSLVNGRRSGWGKVLADAFAFTTFEVGYYAPMIYFVVGASSRQTLVSCASLAVFTLFSGRPYGLWLELVRYWFGINQNSS